MLGQAYVELRGFHDYVLSRSERLLSRWLNQGFERLPSERLLAAISMAFRSSAPFSQYAAVWGQLFPWTPLPAWPGKQGVVLALVEKARGSVPMLYVLERRIERGFQYETPEFKAPPLPSRTATEHYVVIEAVRDTERAEPVPGLRVELLIADGEVRTAQTDANGIARVERIQAGRVVIRVLGLDGHRWRPEQGALARESSRERPHTHVVDRGENLSRIARMYGLRGWKAIWEEPKNEPLRKKRKSPHVLHPGDHLHVPGLPIFEIERETDATHRIVLESYRFESDLGLRLTTELATRLSSGAFALWGRAVFGADVPRAGLERLHGDLRSGALPCVETRLTADLQSHPAAYDSRQRAILLAEDVVLEACSDRTGYAAMLACVLIEEFGHALDDLLRRHYASIGGDTPRDEGARFAYLLLTDSLATAGPLRVGVLFIDGVAHDIVADPDEIAEIIHAVLGPVQQLSDERAETREYADAVSPADHEQGEILYLGLLLAGYSLLDAHALVDLARKLNARWRGASGPAVFYEASPPGKPSPALERLLLSYLLALHRELDQRIRDAPLTADGLPDLGETRWELEEGEALWEAGSPLAGLLEDIAPFGSQQEWIARFHELDVERAAREARVRERARESAKESGGMRREQAQGLGGYVSGLRRFSGAATGDSGPTPVDDALNTTDRTAAAVDTVFSLLEIVGIEVAGSVVVTVAGPLLMLATFVSGLAKVDGQQLAAAKAMGVVFAYFAIKSASLKEPPPRAVTPEDVEREVRFDRDLRALRDNRTQWRGGTPQSVIDEGEKEGIKLVLDALNSNLSGEAMRARHAYERMILEARVENMNESAEERVRREKALSAAYPAHWWATEIRRRTYHELVAAIEAEALTVYRRFGQNAERQK